MCSVSNAAVARAAPNLVVIYVDAGTNRSVSHLDGGRTFRQQLGSANDVPLRIAAGVWVISAGIHENFVLALGIPMESANKKIGHTAKTQRHPYVFE